MTAILRMLAVVASGAFLVLPAQAATFDSLAEYNTSTDVAPDVVITAPGATVVDTFVTTQPDTPPSSLDATNEYLDTADPSVAWNFTFKSPDVAGDVKSGTVTSDTATDQWLLKYGGVMVVVLLSDPTTSLTFSGLDNGLSHYDTGGGTPSEIPLPGAVWLFGGALAGLYGISRRRRQTRPAV